MAARIAELERQDPSLRRRVSVTRALRELEQQVMQLREAQGQPPAEVARLIVVSRRALTPSRRTG